jgi:hypothetical protein
MIGTPSALKKMFAATAKIVHNRNSNLGAKEEFTTMRHCSPRHPRTSCLGTLVGFLVLCLGQLSAQESALRTVQIEPSLPSNLVKVARIEVGNAAVVPGVPFPADDHWFNNVRVVLENVSTKNIVFISGQLRFPQTGDATAENLAVMSRIAAGRKPEHLGDPGTAEGVRGPHVISSMSIATGSQVLVAIVEPPGRIEHLIKKKQASLRITQCVIGINNIYFSDDTFWSSGLYFRPDQESPGLYRRVSREEFDSYRQVESR